MGKGVSSSIHTQEQMDHYSNQYNPNNPACDERIENEKKTQENSQKQSQNDKQNKNEQVSQEGFDSVMLMVFCRVFMFLIFVIECQAL